MRIALALFGWLVPGGGFLLMRRYQRFAAFAVLVCATCLCGLVLQGGVRWPQPAELEGLDGFTAAVFQAAGFAKLLAGLPFLAALLFDVSPGFLAGRLHEYGSTLLVLAGVFNLLAISSALDVRRTER